MKEEEIIQPIMFMAPLLTSFFCLLLLLISYIKGSRNIINKPVLFLMYALSSAILSWLMICFYIYSPTIFVWVHSWCYLFMLLTQVFLYHFVFLFTRTTNTNRFSIIHYLIPALLTTALCFWSFFIPFEVQLAIVEKRGVTPQGYELYTMFFTSKVPMFFVYNLVYSFLGLLRIRKYKKNTPAHSTYEINTSIRWFYMVFILTLATIPLTLIALIIGKANAISSEFAFIPIFITMIQDIILCYTTIAVHYILIDPKQKVKPDSKPENFVKINREKFETYLNEKKPFLNPKIQISDIAYDLNTNRNYLSSFINREYDMNFKRFINTYRLRELSELRLSSENADENELIIKAGFPDSRGYNRAKAVDTINC